MDSPPGALSARPTAVPAVLSFSRLVPAALLGMSLALVSTGPALAHESRDVGEYAFVVGFIEEPVFVGQKSGLEFLVTLGSDPVEGLEELLEAEVIKDDQRRDLPLSPRFGEPGWYQSHFFPTVDGPYTFHIFGEIDGTAIDESFTSSEEGFDEVRGATAGQFPVQFPPTAEVVNAAERGADAADLMPVALALGAAGLLVGLGAVGLALAARRRPG